MNERFFIMNTILTKKMLAKNVIREAGYPAVNYYGDEINNSKIIFVDENNLKIVMENEYGGINLIKILEKDNYELKTIELSMDETSFLNTFLNS